MPINVRVFFKKEHAAARYAASEAVSAGAVSVQYRGESLRQIEREAGVFAFMDGDRTQKGGRPFENLLLFSYSRAAREHGAELVEERVEGWVIADGETPLEGHHRGHVRRARNRPADLVVGTVVVVIGRAAAPAARHLVQSAA